MRFPKILLLLYSVLMLSGCTSIALYTSKPYYARTPKEAITPHKGDVFYIVASFYGQAHHGKQTASGEIFDMYKLTCAHKLYTFGTRLQLTNEENGKTVIVKVNDRGPFVVGRDLDLSYQAAVELGMQNEGIKRLRAEVLDPQ